MCCWVNDARVYLHADEYLWFDLARLIISVFILTAGSKYIQIEPGSGFGGGDDVI